MSKQQLKIAFVALSITGLFCGVLAFSIAHAQLFRANGPVSTLIESTAAPPTTSTARGPIQNLRFTVYDAGIYPRQLRAMPGTVAIVLEDHTRRSPRLVIESETESGLPVRLTSLLLNQARTRTELRLGAGRYRMFDAINPASRAELIIEQ